VGTFFGERGGEGGDGLYKSIFGGPSLESRCYLEELMLEGLLLFTVKETWKDINLLKPSGFFTYHQV
jgi:hypothetical protein